MNQNIEPKEPESSCNLSFVARNGDKLPWERIEQLASPDHPINAISSDNRLVQIVGVCTAKYRKNKRSPQISEMKSVCFYTIAPPAESLYQNIVDIRTMIETEKTYRASIGINHKNWYRAMLAEVEVIATCEESLKNAQAHGLYEYFLMTNDTYKNSFEENMKDNCYSTKTKFLEHYLSPNKISYLLNLKDTRKEDFKLEVGDVVTVLKPIIDRTAQTLTSSFDFLCMDTQYVEIVSTNDDTGVDKRGVAVSHKSVNEHLGSATWIDKDCRYLAILVGEKTGITENDVLMLRSIMEAYWNFKMVGSNKLMADAVKSVMPSIVPPYAKIGSREASPELTASIEEAIEEAFKGTHVGDDDGAISENANHVYGHSLRSLQKRNEEILSGKPNVDIVTSENLAGGRSELQKALDDLLVDVELPKENVVAIDWDETASLNPSLWLRVWCTMEMHGLNPIICTSRSKSDPTNEEIFKHIPKARVLFCEGLTKKRVTEHLGMNVLFWVDDKPEALIDKEDIDKYNSGDF